MSTTLTTAVVVMAAAAPVSADSGVTLERVSVSSSGVQGDGHSVRSALSGNGRYVVFDSRATTFAPTGGGFFNVFWRDLQTGVTERVGVGVGGAVPNSQSSDPVVSDDGRYVAFWSSATNLAPGDTNGVNDAFLFDRQTAATTLLSVAADGTQANGASSMRSISADGRYALFGSAASNLVPGDTNGVVDLFLADTQQDIVTRVSVASDGSEANGQSSSADLSDDGRYVAFYSAASNLVPGDTNNGGDIFLRDLVAGTTERVSVTSSGTEVNATLFSSRVGVSAGGRYVAFQSNADSLTPNDTSSGNDIFIRDRVAGTTELVSRAFTGALSNGQSHSPSLSSDGRRVLFQSSASNLVPGDTNATVDTFVSDLDTGTTVRVSVAEDGIQQSSGTQDGVISGDGTRFLFASTAANLTAGDTNGVFDVFTGSVPAGTPTDTTPPTLTLPDPVTAAATSPEGTAVRYTALATDNEDPAPAVDCTPASSTVFPLGETTVNCVATDAAGNTSTGSFTVTVTDQDDPHVSVTSPVDGAAVAGTVDLAATATDVVGVTAVQFLVDGTLIGTADTTAPFTGSWDATNAVPGAHTIRAIARDEAGHTTTSAPVTVQVAPPDPATPLVWHSLGGTGALWVGSASSTARQIFTGDALNASWSPDRVKVAFASNRDGNYDIWIMDVATGALTNLTQTRTGFNDDPAWSPDGTRIAFTSNRDGDYEIYTLRVDGTGLRQLTNDTEPRDGFPAWSPDARRLVFTSVGDLVTVRADGTDRRVISATSNIDEAPAWSPDGTRIAYSFPSTGGSEVHTIRPDGTDDQRVTALGERVSQPTWSPDGNRIAMSVFVNNDWDVWSMNLDGTNRSNVSRQATVADLAPDWGQTPVPADTTKPVLQLPTSPVTREATSSAGAEVTYTATATDETDGSPVVVCTPPSGSVFAIGTTTVQCTATDEAGNTATGSFTATVHDTTGPIVALTSPANGATVTGNVNLAATASDAVGVSSVKFTVDGANAAIDSTAPYTGTWDATGATPGVHTVRAVATDTAGNQTASSPVTVQVPQPQASGPELVWVRAGSVTETGTGGLWAATPGGTPRRLMLRQNSSAPSWSPDRTQIAFTSTRDGNSDVWVVNVVTGATSNVTRDTRMNLFPAWSPDGQRIAYASNRDGDHEIWTIRPDGTSAQQVTRNTTDDTMPTWSPDGTQLAYMGTGGVRVISANGSGDRLLPLPSTATGQQPAWSPDGRQLALTRLRQGIHVVNLDGTGFRRIVAPSTGIAQHPTWSPDGRMIAYNHATGGGNGEVMAIDVTGGTPLNVSNFPTDGDYEPDWGQTKVTGTPEVTTCPDYGVPGVCGVTIRIPNPNPGPMPGGTVTISTGTGTNGVTLSPTTNTSSAGSSGGQTCTQQTGRIVCTIGSIPVGGTVIRVDVTPNGPGSWTPQVIWNCGCGTGGPVVVTQPPMTATQYCVGGQILFDSDAMLPLLDVFAATLDGRVQELSASSANEEAGAVWAPNRRAFAMNVGVPGRRKIFVVGLNSAGCIIGQAAVPNQPAGDNYQPDWSGDGTRLAFVSNNAGNHDIWTIGINGSQLTRLTTNPGNDRAPSFSADGSLVAFTSNRATPSGTDWDIYTVQTGTPRRETLLSTAASGYNPAGADYSPSFSRRAGTSQIVWHTNSGGNWDLWLMNSNGTNKRRVPNSTALEEKNADWAQDDTKIVYDAGEPGDADIWMMNADGTNRHRVAGTEGDDKAPSY
ncbi:Ig-like domain-containing protein [Nocardioides gansuensis]|uniref:Ig-like domain-containing protein n=1 Tax=Nocardioides gansuensis TaxID=2138300 RepID=UPI001402C00D|nr:Ig-like domain-containing protein [Nocardioides gansuensis]